MPDEDISIDEKRVYADQAGEVEVAVATGMGVATVSVSGEQRGEYGLATRVDARDVVTHGDGVAVATPDDVLLGRPADLTPTDVGPATAVGRRDGALLAATEDGAIRHWDGDGWTTLATLEHGVEVRALDGGLVAASDGLHRITGTGLEPAGLDDARDVAGGPIPFAATASGLYRLGNGWLDVIDGDARVVTVTADAGGVERGHAAIRDAFYEHVDGEWVARDVDGPVAAVTHGPRTYGITDDGTFLLRGADRWHTHVIGLPDARALAVVGAANNKS